jgi:VCBS repeat-containing protein
VAIAITPVNDAPLIEGTNPSPLEMAEDGSIDLTNGLVVTDPDNTYPTDFVVTPQPDPNPQPLYTVSGSQVAPAPDYFGPLAVPVIVNDGLADSDVVDLSITVLPVNDRPVIVAVNDIGMDEDTSRAITVNDLDVTDIDNTEADLQVVVLPGDGYAVSGDATTITPTLNLNGKLTVPVQVTDGIDLSDQANIEVEVLPVNDPPIFISLPSTSAVEDQSYLSTVVVQDVDIGDQIRLTASILPSWITSFDDNFNGTATISGTPTNDNVGTTNNTLQIRATDGSVTVQASVTINVQNVNDPPFFVSSPVTSAEQGLEYRYEVETDDPDVGDTLRITGTYPVWLFLTDRGDGTALLSGTPTNDDFLNQPPGGYPVTLTVTDLAGVAVQQSFQITVNNVNDPPIAVDDNNDDDPVVEDVDNESTGNVRANDSDPDGNAPNTLEITAVDGQPTPRTVPGTYGSLNLAVDGDYTYTLNNADPDTNALSQGQIATEVFTYTVTDPDGLSDQGQLTIRVTGSNDVPVAGALCSEIALDARLTGDLSAAVTDPDDTSATLSFQGPSTTAKGTVDIAVTGAYTYTPNSGARGLDTFTYQVTDEAGASDSNQVRIVIGDTLIMPLGDSITQGITAGSIVGSLPTPGSRVGYRRSLYDQLSAVRDYPVDFVGNLSNGLSATPPIDDPDHQGTPGDTATDTATGISGWLDSNPADIVLLHTGTNDFLNTSAAEVEEILNNINTWENSSGGNVTVFLAQIIGRNDGVNNNLVRAYNRDLADLAANRPDVFIVDQYNALIYPDDLEGDPLGIHPSQEGYDKMANTWRNALDAAAASNPSLLPRCP